MKTFLCTVLLALWASVAYAQQPITVFLGVGQSNMFGYGRMLQLAPVPMWAQTEAHGWEGHPTRSFDTGIEYPRPTLVNAPALYNHGCFNGATFDSWGAYVGQTPKMPSGAISEEDKYGPELAFLARWRQDHPGEDVAFIKCDVGGTSLAYWMPPSGQGWQMLSLMIDQAKGRLAGREIRWGGLLLMHGENGASTTYSYLNGIQDYAPHLRTFVSAVRALASPEMPVLIGRIGNHMLADVIILPLVTSTNTAEILRGATEWRRSQQVDVGEDDGNAWVNTDDLPVLQTGPSQWWYHHTSVGYLAMGERFYAALAGVVPPPAPPVITYTVTIDGVPYPGAIATITVNGDPIGAPGDVIVVDVEGDSP